MPTWELPAPSHALAYEARKAPGGGNIRLGAAGLSVLVRMVERGIREYAHVNGAAGK